MNDLYLSDLNFARFIERAKVGQVFVIHHIKDDYVKSDYNSQYVLLAINDDEELYITDKDFKFIKRCVLDAILANNDNTFDRFDIPEILIETYCPRTDGNGIYENTFSILDPDNIYDIESEIVQSFKLVRNISKEDEPS